MFARRADLNIGIVTAVWSLTPFFIAVFDKIIYGSKIKFYHILGMLLVVVMALIISLPNHTEKTVVKAEMTDLTPTYQAVLLGLMFPVFTSAWTLLVKYVNRTVRLEQNDWMFAYNLILGVFLTTIGIFSFYRDEETFSWTHL